MPPRANELFARKDMDFLLILEKPTTTNSEKERRRRENQDCAN